MAWIKPTGFVDSENKWTDEAFSYDDHTGTYAYNAVPKSSWGAFIELTHLSMSCNKVRFDAFYEAGYVESIDVDAYYDGTWNHLYEGTFLNHEWVEKLLASTKIITVFRFRFYNVNAIYERNTALIEVNYFEPVAPTVTVQAPTDVGQTTVTANGTITAAGENATIRGFKYGLTQTDIWDAHTDGSFPIGAFTKGLTGLIANTEYWIRAYATNSIGTSYSGWIQFQTAASGTIPTGTKLNICSDYSGYTYKLNASLTDDGEAYESFFVLSTDLAGGQGLHINKRLLDIFSYFTKKESGTAKIYIKQDSEAEWQYAGEIPLTGDEDIVIPHLPVDFLAKHDLIKFLFENDFEFIGLITESVSIGVR